jgi:hypothetical protein
MLINFHRFPVQYRNLHQQPQSGTAFGAFSGVGTLIAILFFAFFPPAFLNSFRMPSHRRIPTVRKKQVLAVLSKVCRRQEKIFSKMTSEA